MRLFDTSGFVPRWYCGDWDGGLGWLAVVAHCVTALVYVLIPLQLLWAGTRRTDLPFRSQAFLFAAFVFACGLAHVVSAVVFWTPVYRLAVAWDVVTAMISIVAYARLKPVIPEVVAMRTPKELEAEIERRKAAESVTTQKIDELTRTERDLRHANRDLQNVLATKKELERRVRELESHQAPDATGTTPTRAAIARMDEATRVVALSLSPTPDGSGRD